QRGQRPGLRPQPRVVPLGPGLFRGGEAAAVAEQELRETVAGAKEVSPNIFATAQQIAGGFFLLGRNVNDREGAGPIEHGEVARITAVGLDAIAGATGNERGSDDLAGNV